MHRLPPLLGQVPRRRDRCRGDGRRQQPIGRERGHLLGDGHGQHDGVHCRGAGHDDARRRVAARGDRGPHPDRRGDRRAVGPDGTRQADDRQDPHAGRVRECDARPPVDWRLDQRDRAPDCDRRPRGSRHRPPDAGPNGARDAGPAGSQALGPALHGGFPPRRRDGDVAAGAETLAAPRGADRDRTHAGRRNRTGRTGLRAGRRAQPARSDLSAGRHRGAARQSGAGRRHHQAIRRGRDADGARGSRGRLRKHARTSRNASTRMRWT